MAIDGALIHPNTIWVGLFAMTLIAVYFLYKTLTEPKIKELCSTNETKEKNIELVPDG